VKALLVRLAPCADPAGFVAGWVALEYGVSRWSSPAAWVLGGIVLMAVAIVPIQRKGKR
jgi:hypothetical protein